MMSLRKLAVVSTLALLAQLAAAADIPYDSLVGKWRSEEIDTVGNLVVTQLEISPDHTFRGEQLENDKLTWKFDGTCELKGKEMTWTYVNSSKHIEEMQDTDVILKVDAHQFIFKTKEKSQPGLYKRVE